MLSLVRTRVMDTINRSANHRAGIVLMLGLLLFILGLGFVIARNEIVAAENCIRYHEVVAQLREHSSRSEDVFSPTSSGPVEAAASGTGEATRIDPGDYGCEVPHRAIEVLIGTTSLRMTFYGTIASICFGAFAVIAIFMGVALRGRCQTA